MDKHNENFSEEMENRRKYQIESRELKNTITELKSSLEGFHSSLDEVEERISELKVKAVKIVQSEEEEKLRKNEDSLRDI